MGEWQGFRPRGMLEICFEVSVVEFTNLVGVRLAWLWFPFNHLQATKKAKYLL